MNKIILILFITFSTVYASKYTNIICIDKNKKVYNIKRSVKVIIINEKYKAYYAGSVYGDDSVYKNKTYTYGFALDVENYYADFFIENTYGYYSTGKCTIED